MRRTYSIYYGSTLIGKYFDLEMIIYLRNLHIKPHNAIYYQSPVLSEQYVSDRRATNPDTEVWREKISGKAYFIKP